MCTKSQGRKAVIPIQTRLDLPACIEESLAEMGAGFGSVWGQKRWQQHSGSTHWHEPSQRPPVVPLNREHNDLKFTGCRIGILGGKFVAIQSQINNLTLYLKQIEKEEQTKPKISRRKGIVKIRAEINEIGRKQ